MSVFAAVMWGGLGAAALLAGAVIAIFHKPSERTTGMIMAFGSGTLISAIAYELIPDSVLGNAAGMAVAFVAGALVFFLSNLLIDHMGGANRKRLAGDGEDNSGTAIFLGTLLDGVPESIILGTGLSRGGSISIAFLVAVFVSNLPEGIAGTLNLQAKGFSRRKILLMWTALVAASAIAAGVGYLTAQEMKVSSGLYLQAFAAGAMLTMLADTMMPEAFEHGGKIVGLLTVAGYLAAAILSVLD